MALKPNAPMTFVGAEFVDSGGIILRFVCHDPGPGEPSDYEIKLTDAVVATLDTEQKWAQAALVELTRKYRKTSVIAARLDALVGKTLTLP